MPTVETVLATCSYLNHGNPLRDWHNETHPGVFRQCRLEPCRSGQIERWHYDAGHPYAPDFCDLQPCHALAHLRSYDTATGRHIAGRLSPATVAGPDERKPS